MYCVSSRKNFSRIQREEKFIKLVKEFQVHKTTIILNINVVTLIDKYSKLMKSSMALGFLKNYCKDTKKNCDKNSNREGFK